MSRPLKLKVHGAAYQRLSNSPIMGSKGKFAGAHRRRFFFRAIEEPSLTPLHATAELRGMLTWMRCGVSARFCLGMLLATGGRADR